MTDDEKFDQIVAKFAELERQYAHLESTHIDLVREVVSTVSVITQENELCLQALRDILEFKTGVLVIAEQAVKRIAALREQHARTLPFNP